MVYVKLAYLALFACFCQVSDAHSVRRYRPACPVPRVAQVPAPAAQSPCMSNLRARYRYECSLEDIISKLVNALIYTVVHKDGAGGGGAGGGSGAGAGPGKGGSGGVGGGGSGNNSGSGALGSLLGLSLEAGDKSLLELDVLGDSFGEGSSGAKSNNGLSILDVDLLNELLSLELTSGLLGGRH